MSDKKTYTLEIRAKGLKEATKGLKELAASGKAVEKSTGQSTTANKAYVKSQSDVTKSNKGIGQSTNNTTKSFSKMASGIEGTLVPAYAAVAANVFALTAAFGALSRAADLDILIKASEQLAVTTGRNLAVVAQSVKELTGNAISLQEALSNVSLAASAGFDNNTIEQLATVAKNASVALGRDLTDSLNRVFKGAIKAEPELLDELGIIVRLDKATRDYAATIGKNVKLLTTFEKQTAVVNAVLDEGSKKFSAIEDVDVNKFSQLAAVFADVAVSVTNFIAQPLGPVVSFFTENIESLTAALVIFGASILKTAFPALEKFSTLINTKLDDTVSSLQGSITKLTDFKLGLLPDTEIKKVETNGKALRNVLLGLEARYKEAGKPVPIGITNALKAVTGSAKQAEKALQSFRATEKNVRGGGKSLIGINLGEVQLLKKSAEDLKTSLLAAKNVASDKATVAKGFVATLGTLVANTGIAVTNFGINVVSSTFKSIAAVSAETNAWKALGQTIIQTKIAATTDVGLISKIFGTAGAAIGGLGASLFKAIPLIGTIVIAFQLLGTALSFLKGLFFDEDVIKLSESLEKQDKALIASAKSVKFYKTNLASLVPTLSNVNKQLTLQANILTELFGNIDEVVNDVDLSEGFGVWQNFLDLFGLGDLDEFKDQVESLSTQLKDLGFVKEVNLLLEDYEDIIRLSGKSSKVLGRALRDLSKELRDNAQGAREANEQISDGIQAINKSVTQLVDGLPQLSALEKTFIGIDSSIRQLDTGNVDQLVTAIQELSGFALEEFGLTNLVNDITPATIALEQLSTQLNIASESRRLLNEAREAGRRGPLQIEGLAQLNSEIKALEIGIKDTNSFISELADQAVAQLEKVSQEFKNINDAQRVFIAASQRVKFELSLPNNSLIERFELTKDLEALERQRLQSANGRTETQLLNVNKALIRQKDLVKQASDALKELNSRDVVSINERNKLTDKLGAAEAAVLQSSTFQAQLISKQDSDRGKSIASYQKNVVAAEKELNKIYALQAQGAVGLASSADFFEKAYTDAIAAVALALDDTLGSDGASFIAGQVLDAKQDIEEFNALLKETRVGNFEQSVKRTDTSNINREDIEFELEANRTLNGLLDERIDRQQLVDVARLDSAIATLTAEQQFQDNVNIYTESQRQLLQLQEERTAKIGEGQALQDQALAVALRSAVIERKSAISKLKLGSSASKQRRDELVIEGKIAASKLKETKTLRRELLAAAKASRQIDFESSVRKGAEAMNELADAMKRVTDNAEFGGVSAGLLLLKDVGDNINSNFGRLTSGFATLGLAAENYGIELSKIDNDKQLSQTEKDLKGNKLALATVANAAGALAGAFEEGSSAAKTFTLIQQGAAIASAAAAIATQGAGDPYSAFARIAAMISLMSSVLGAAGIAFSGGGSSGGSAKRDYETRLGNDSLRDRDLDSNFLNDSIQQLVEIDTQLFSASEKLQISINKLGTTFERLGGLLVSGSRSFGPGNTNQFLSESTSQNSKDLVDLTKNFVDTFTLGLGGNLAGDIAGGLFGKTKVETSAIDTGIDFSTVIRVTEEGLEGFFSSLTQETSVLVKETTKSLFSSSSSSSIQSVFNDLDPRISGALNDALGQTLNVINSLVLGLGDAVGGINIAALFSGLDTDTFGDEFLSLFEQNADESAESIALFFSSLTEDILVEVLPFLAEASNAGEELLRITENTILLAGLVSTVGLELSDVIGGLDSTSAAFIDAARKNVLGDTLKNMILEIGRWEQQIEAIRTSRGNIGNRFGEDNASLVAEVEGYITNIKVQIAKLTVAALIGSNTGLEAQINSAATKAAEAFKLEVAAAWEDALLAEFKDLDQFSELFSKFSTTLFSESELLDISINNASNSISAGFSELVTQIDGFSSAELANLIESNGGDLSATVRQIYDDLIEAGTFNSEILNGTEIDTTGAKIFATMVKLGASIGILDAILIDTTKEIENLNNKYIQQIAIFGKTGKELDLLNLAFDFADAIEEAKRTGTAIELVELDFGLRRLQIVKDSFEDINKEITTAMDGVFDSIISVSKNLDVFDDIAFSAIKVNKLVDRLRKGSIKLNLDSLLTSNSDLEDFVDDFSSIVGRLVTDAPNDIQEEIAIVNQLKDEILNKYNLESQLIDDQSNNFKQLSRDINNFLDSLILSDLSTLTNFEKLGEATNQFLQNATDVFSTDVDIADNASGKLLDSAGSLLDIASLFFSIGPEYVKVFDLVSSTLSGIDENLLSELQTANDPLVDLTNDVISQLGVLDDILIELQSANESVYFSDIAAAISDGLSPLISDVTDKLQAIDDGSWSTMVGLLTLIDINNKINAQGSSASIANLIELTKGIQGVSEGKWDAMIAFLNTIDASGTAGVLETIRAGQVFSSTIVNVFSGTLSDMVDILGSISDSSKTTLEELKAGAITATINTSTGAISTTTAPSTPGTPDSSGTPSTTPAPIRERIQDIRTLVPPYNSEKYKALLTDSFFDNPAIENASKTLVFGGNSSDKLIDTYVKQGVRYGVIESFATGTPEVPNDMLANIHAGEAIVPATFAQGLRDGTLSLGSPQDNTEVVDAIKELTLVLAESQEDIADIASRNVEVSQDIASSMSNIPAVRTSGVL